MGYKNAMDEDCESIYHSTTSFHRGQNGYINIPPPTQNGSGFVFSFLETQKEHSVSLYSLSVTTAKPLVCSIFANRHNYLNSKYKLNYAMARAFALRSVGRCGNASRYVEITIGFHNMRDTHIDTSAKLILCGDPLGSYLSSNGHSTPDTLKSKLNHVCNVDEPLCSIERRTK